MKHNTILSILSILVSLSAPLISNQLPPEYDRIVKQADTAYSARDIPTLKTMQENTEQVLESIKNRIGVIERSLAWEEQTQKP